MGLSLFFVSGTPLDTPYCGAFPTVLSIACYKNVLKHVSRRRSQPVLTGFVDQTPTSLGDDGRSYHYALLLEEQWGLPVETGAIYLIPLKKVVKVQMTQRLRNDALHHIVEIRTQIAAQRVPPPTHQRSRCVNCEFRRFCNDVI